MKPVNKTRRTAEHSGMIKETRAYCKNESRIVRVSEKRASRKADRFYNKIMLMHEYGHCHEFEFDHEFEFEYEGYLRWKYGDSASPMRMKLTIRAFTHLPWWTLLGKVRYQEGFRTWYR